MFDPMAEFDRADTHPKSLDTFDPEGAFGDAARELGEAAPDMKQAAADMKQAAAKMADDAGLGGGPPKEFDPEGDFGKATRGEARNEAQRDVRFDEQAPMALPFVRGKSRPKPGHEVEADLKMAADAMEKHQQAAGEKEITEPLGELSDAMSQAGMHEGAAKINKAVDTGKTVARAAAGDPIAIMQLAKQAADEVKERADALYQGAKGAGREGFNALSSDRAGDVLSHGSAAGEHAMHGAGRALEGTGLEHFAKAGEQVFKFGRMMGDSLEGLRRWNDRLFEGNVRFAEFSSAMTQVEVEQELRAMDVSRQRGDAQAATAKEQAEAKARLDKALQPFETWWANFTNRASAKTSDYLSGVINSMGWGDEDDPEAQAAHKQGTETRKNFADGLGWVIPAGVAKKGWDAVSDWASRFGRRDNKGPGGVR
jgi:hypothetical protein